MYEMKTMRHNQILEQYEDKWFPSKVRERYKIKSVDDGDVSGEADQ